MKRKPYVDFLRLIASLAVVTIHLTARYAGLPPTSEETCIGDIAYVMGSLCNFAVSLFMMVTGSLLLGRAERWSVFIKKRYSRLLPPFVFWNCFYLFIALLFATNLSCSERLTQFALKLFSASHLWYLPMLLLVTLFVPLVNDAITGRKMTAGDWRIMLGIGCSVIVLYQVSMLLEQVGYGRPSWFNGLPFLLCLLLGYYLDLHAEFLKKWLPFLLLTTSCILLCGLAVGLCVRGSGVEFVLFNNLGLFSILTATVLFLLGRCSPQNWFARKWICVISDCSFGVYLVHPFFLRVIERVFGKQMEFILFSSSPLIVIAAVLALILVCYACSFVSVFLLRKVNWGRIVC